MQHSAYFGTDGWAVSYTHLDVYKRQLQAEWDEYGEDKFVFEVVEVVKVRDDPNFNVEDELTLLEQIWLEQLQPFGERGYNTSERIRQA